MERRIKFLGIEYRRYECGSYLKIGKKWITIHENGGQEWPLFFRLRLWNISRMCPGAIVKIFTYSLDCEIKDY